MTTKRILIIEDEANMRHMLEVLLGRSGYEVKSAADGQEGLEVIEGEGFHFILCDIKMPRMDGMAFLRSATDKLKDTTVIMMSAYGTVDTAIEAMKLGAYDYISKPFKADEVLLTLKKAEEREGLKSENLRLKDRIQRIEKSYNFNNIVAKSKAMHSVFDMIKKVADYKTTVLITGESGTGKELIARAIHFNGSRHNGPIVSINCGGIPETLLESELFGYKKGAFTDAKQDKPGRFAEAHRGTLFLDEIGELPLSLQVKLLRVLQDEEITPLGSTGIKKVDARIIAATAKNLGEETKNGHFREDLYYRINVVNIYLPPLRERLEDIPLLTDHFVNHFNSKLKKNIKWVSPQAMEQFMTYPWPGNVRELENVIERAILLAPGNTLEVSDLPPTLKGDLYLPSGLTPDGISSIKIASRILEKELIERALTKTSGNRTKAAKMLEISRPILISKIKDYKLD
ncbi:MAG: sigma-54-dependent Fis family transcriptional regulator [Deltaproteobacteria bacterium]|nr:MAG: sigma-54-dependent Fis family transcriptional regulator [Deltaproteobacteria bacterium]